MPIRSFALLVAVICGLGAAAMLPGCSTQHLDSPQAVELAKLKYPEEAQVGPALDIVVSTSGNDLRLANRTPRRYENMQLWLNRQYVRRVDAVVIGTDNEFSLPSFINSFREPFPTGGLLSPDERRPVVLAELYDPASNVRYPLTVAQP